MLTDAHFNEIKLFILVRAVESILMDALCHVCWSLKQFQSMFSQCSRRARRDGNRVGATRRAAINK